MHNLLVNALKFTQKGFIKIQLEDIGNNIFSVSVQDSGNILLTFLLIFFFFKKIQFKIFLYY